MRSRLLRAAANLLLDTVNLQGRPVPLRAESLQKRALPEPEEYWTSYNVTAHKSFQNREESLRYFHWRTDQYVDYLKYMPVEGFDGKAILDYGCGPGHDLVGFVEYSRPKRLIGVDVSEPSLIEARRRLALHGASPELYHVSEEAERLPFPDASFDYVHCSGVLHHVSHPGRVLKEIRRVLKKDGGIGLMVYNYDCIWLHLFAAYKMRLLQCSGQGLTMQDAFRRSTDTADCPISRAWKPKDMAALCREAGLTAHHLGNAVSARELAILHERFEAILHPDLEEDHRRFLVSLTFDNRGIPYYQGQAAGIDACYQLQHIEQKFGR